MSEMEKLKEETQRQYVKQRMDDVGAYLDELIEECEQKFRYTLRCDLLETFCFFGYWAVLMLCIFLDVSDTVQDVATELAFIVWLVAIFRGYIHNRAWAKKEGEWAGAVTVLRKLGMLNEPPAKRVRNKEWHPFAGLVETWNRAKQAAQDAVWKPA